MNLFRLIPQKLTAAIVAVAFVLGTTGPVFEPPRAHAITVTVVGGSGTVSDILSSIKNTVSAAADVITSLNISSLVVKEYTLDGIAFKIARLLLNEMRKSIIRWINSGFQGSPAFITDLERWLLDVADQIIGEFIYGSELSFLCSPFELDVRIALATAVNNYDERVQCTLSDVVGNVENFFTGDFLAGGLPGWFEVTQNANNNYFGAQASAKVALRGRLADGREMELQLLNWGNGFISQEGCVTLGDDEECLINLPGKAISDALTVQVDGDSQALLTADEINEIFSALFVQMTRQALTGAAGLLGLTQPSSRYGGRSYIDAVGDSRYDSTPGSSIDTQDPIAAAVADEEAYIRVYEGVVDRADALLEAVEEYEEPTPRGGDNDPETCDVPSYIPKRAEAIKEQVEGNIAAADANIVVLEDLIARYTAAGLLEDQIAGSEEQLSVLNEFTTLQATGVLHSRITIAEEEFEVDELNDELGDLQDDLKEACEGDEGRSGGGDGGN